MSFLTGNVMSLVFMPKHFKALWFLCRWKVSTPPSPPPPPPELPILHWVVYSINITSASL